MVVWEAWTAQSGVDPFTHKLDERGHITHGHLAEDNNHGGAYSLGVNPHEFPTCLAQQVTISGLPVQPRATSAPPAPSAASPRSTRASR